MGMVFWRRNREEGGYKSIWSSQYRSCACDNTLKNYLIFFQASSFSRDYLCMIYEKTKGQVPVGPLLGKQNIQAKEVYWHMPKGTPNFN